MDNWIKIDDGKPVVGERVLLLLEGETMLLGRLNSNGWSAFFADGEKATGTREVTHWTYLPALPNETKVATINDDRKKFAMAAMQGLLANSNVTEMSTTEWNAIFRDSVEAADALLLELSKPQP